MFAPHHAALAAAVLLTLASSSANACRSGDDCYDTVRYREVIETPPAIVVQPERIIVAPGRVDTVRMPPETATILQEVVVQPAGYSWRRSYGPDGQPCCAVPVPAETKLVMRDVIVRPSRRVSVITPPAHRWRNRVVAVRPGARAVVDYRATTTRKRTRIRVRRTTTIQEPLWFGW